MHVIAFYNNHTNFLTSYAEKPNGPLYPIYAREMSDDIPNLDACEEMFGLLNVDDRPGGRVFRSMSVGDVIGIFDDGSPSFYSCDPLGFSPLAYEDVTIDPDGIALLGLGSKVAAQMMDVGD